MLGVCLYHSLKQYRFSVYVWVITIILMFGNWGIYGYELLFGIFVGVFARERTLVINPQGASVIRELSKMSFSVYLLHPWVLNVIGGLALKYRFWGTRWMLIFMVGASLGVPWIVYHFVIIPLEEKLKSILIKDCG